MILLGGPPWVCPFCLRKYHELWRKFKYSRDSWSISCLSWDFRSTKPWRLKLLRAGLQEWPRSIWRQLWWTLVQSSKPYHLRTSPCGQRQISKWQYISIRIPNIGMLQIWHIFRFPSPGYLIFAQELYFVPRFSATLASVILQEACFRQRNRQLLCPGPSWLSSPIVKMDQDADCGYQFHRSFHYPAQSKLTALFEQMATSCSTCFGQRWCSFPRWGCSRPERDRPGWCQRCHRPRGPSQECFARFQRLPCKQ